MKDFLLLVAIGSLVAVAINADKVVFIVGCYCGFGCDHPGAFWLP